VKLSVEMVLATGVLPIASQHESEKTLRGVKRERTLYSFIYVRFEVVASWLPNSNPTAPQRFNRGRSHDN